jgi:mRNA-degrading endonuclease RelE of RelBE toxin-antitoxin system
VIEDQPYRPDLRPRAQRKIDRLPEKIATAVLEFILGPLLDNPRRVGAPLEDEYAGQYSARRGREWRIRYEIDEETRTVRILDIAHRSDVYY